MPLSKCPELNVPDDLMVDIRGGKLKLWRRSGALYAEYELSGRSGVFADGPVSWKDLKFRNILPALAQFTKQKSDDADL